MSDIEKSFTFLHDSIPSWLKQLAEIEEKVAQMREEMAKVPVSRSPPMRHKTGSMESIRDLDAIMEESSARGAPQQSAVVNRKRKTTSVLSGHASAPMKYRSRTMVVVQYDGQIQKSFETLVRNIGTGRNMLRKGKMAAKMEAFAELANNDSEDDDDDDDIMAKISYRHRTGLSSMRTRAAMRDGAANTPSQSTQEMFDTSDKSLEVAQGLCEKAAHLSLRDGDCRKELESVTKHFEDVLATSTKEIAKAIERREREGAQEASKIEAVAPVIEAKPILPDLRDTVSSVQTTAKAVDIEIDDESDEDDFVMPPIRLTSRV